MVSNCSGRGRLPSGKCRPNYSKRPCNGTRNPPDWLCKRFNNTVRKRIPKRVEQTFSGMTTSPSSYSDVANYKKAPRARPASPKRPSSPPKMKPASPAHRISRSVKGDFVETTKYDARPGLMPDVGDIVRVHREDKNAQTGEFVKGWLADEYVEGKVTSVDLANRWFLMNNYRGVKNFKEECEEGSMRLTVEIVKEA